MTEQTIDLPRVLIVDDSKIVRASITKQIKNSFQVLEATDGEAGWEVLANDNTIRVVISDISMPKLDGYGLLERIRASNVSRIKQIPVIIISGDEDEAAKAKAAGAGATDFIGKATGAVELLSRLESLVKLGIKSEQLEQTREVVEQKATTDALTGLGTIHFLTLQGTQILSYAKRHNLPVAVLRIGLDNYEQVIKQHGEKLSDQLLVLLAKLLSVKMRKEDSIARTGNNQFSIILPNAPLESANIFATRSREAIAIARINYQDTVIKTTISIGVSNTVIDSVETIEDMLKIAEQRLQSARERGGNTIVGLGQAPAASAPPPDLEQALKALEAGKAEKIAPYLAHLLKRLLPLLQLCNTKLNLGLPLEKISEKLK
jgi:diguanylate cyclase (GGDEF)-like protein